MLPLLTLLVACAPEAEEWASAFKIAAQDQTIGGPKALARAGDFLIENDRVRFAILGARTSMGPHTSGASIIDADLQRRNPELRGGHGLDQLSELFPTVNLNVQQADAEDGEVVVLQDGSDGGDAVICTAGPERSFINLLDGLWVIQGEPAMQIRTDYTLSPGSGALHMRTTAVMGADVDCASDLASFSPVPAETAVEELPLLTWALENGAVLGDFYLQGGSVNVFTAGHGFFEKGMIHERNLAGINSFQDPIPVDFLAGTGDRVSYGLMPVQDKLFIPLFTSSQTVAMGGGMEGDGTPGRFADGLAIQYDRWFSVGSGDVGSALDALLEAQEVPTGRVDGQVLEAGTGTPLSGLHVFVYAAGADAPWSEWKTDVGEDPTADGSFGGQLPVGQWELLVHGQGRPDPARVPIEVTEGGHCELVLSSPAPGSVAFEIRDEAGWLVPSKLSIFSVDGSGELNPVLGDPYIGGSPAHVAFTLDGHGSLILPPGTYQAIASRGPEYELGISEPFEVTDRSHVELSLQVIRSVDTSGWIAADFHVHGAGSHDSGVSKAQRVATMAAEGVEFFASTDHDVITDHQPTIEALGMEAWIQSTVGLEVTTLELGHFLGFPLQIDHGADAGGAIDWTGMTPDEMMDGLRALGLPGMADPVVFVGHPRDGILGYFDQYGLDPYILDNGDVAIDPGFLAIFNEQLSPGLFSLDFDALEILNGKRFELIRTPTQPELDAYAADPEGFDRYQMLLRSEEEQQDLADGVLHLGVGLHAGHPIRVVGALRAVHMQIGGHPMAWARIAPRHGLRAGRSPPQAQQWLGTLHPVQCTPHPKAWSGAVGCPSCSAAPPSPPSSSSSSWARGAQPLGPAAAWHPMRPWRTGHRRPHWPRRSFRTGSRWRSKPPPPACPISPPKAAMPATSTSTTTGPPAPMDRAATKR